MWTIPPPLFAGDQADISLTIDTDTYIGDLYVFLGSPSGIKSVELTVDGADVGEIIIPTDFAAGSTFEFIAINNGRFLGEGGNGGNGGPDFGATGEAGSGGASGTPAILNQGSYPVSINVDAGYLFGGGGGGGGGSYTDTGTGGDAGGGGGGGQGWSGGSGGLKGNPYVGVPAPTDGAAGSRVAAGAAGIAGGPGFSATSNGGAGGTWGLGGATGRSSNMVSFGSLGGFFYYGGIGGNAGDAYSGGSLTLSGASSEAALRADGRILGEIGPNKLTTPSFAFQFFAATGIGISANVGLSFQSGGATLEINSASSPTASSTYYLTGGSGTGSDYEVRVRGLTGDVDNGSFTVEAAVPGTWVAISALRQWYWTVLNQTRGALFEMRRADIPGTTSTSDEVMESFYLKVTNEDAS